jgi:hypothetical protein
MNRTFMIVGVLALLVVGAIIWSQVTGGESPILTTTENGSQGSATVSALLDMRSLKLDGRLFDNPAFVSLIDTNKEIIPEPVGRANPFAPIGTDDVLITPSDSGTDVSEDEGEFSE